MCGNGSLSMKKLNNGYSIAGILIIFTLSSVAFLLTVSYVSFYINLSNLRLKKSTGYDDYFKVLYEIKEKYFEIPVKANFTSEFDGWYSDLPSDKDGFTVSYKVLDCFIDINQINQKFFKLNKNELISSIRSGSKDMDIINYIYNNEMLKSFSLTLNNKMKQMMQI